MVNVEVKKMDIVADAMFYHEETDWSSPIIVAAKIDSNKESYTLSTNITSKNFPPDLEARLGFIGCLGECILQAVAQAEKQIEKPLQLELFANYALGYDEVDKAIAGKVRAALTEVGEPAM